jgi:nucleosome binding factor SPN SPT16 subunit
VTSIEDIELVHFERVSLAVKNFDFVLVYKDFANFKRISSIPMENLDMIKEWIDDSEIVYTEGPISLNWS